MDPWRVAGRGGETPKEENPRRVAISG